MGWTKISDDYPDHPKVSPLSDAAFRFHVTVLSWCNRYCSDGVVSNAILKQLTVHLKGRKGWKSLVNELLDAKLFEKRDRGILVHDFLDYNPSKEQVLKRKRANAERQKSWRESRRDKDPDNDVSNSERNDVTNDVTNGVSNARPTRPDPYKEEEEDRDVDSANKSSHASSGSATVGEPPAGCGDCGVFGNAIGWNPERKRPCSCPLGQWRVDYRRATGAWPIGPDPPTTRKGRRRANSRELTPEQQAELDEILAASEARPEPARPPV